MCSFLLVLAAAGIGVDENVVCYLFVLQLLYNVPHHWLVVNCKVLAIESLGLSLLSKSESFCSFEHTSQPHHHHRKFTHIIDDDDDVWRGNQGKLPRLAGFCAFGGCFLSPFSPSKIRENPNHIFSLLTTESLFRPSCCIVSANNVMISCPLTV